MPVITRRRLLATALATGATPLLARAVRAQSTVKIGRAVLGDYAMAGPVIVALEQGLFKAEGLEVEYVPFRGGPDLLKAVMAGECPHAPGLGDAEVEQPDPVRGRGRDRQAGRCHPEEPAGALPRAQAGA